MNFPKKFKLYKQGNRSVVCCRPQRTSKTLGEEAYDGLENVKEINLGYDNDPNPVFVAIDLQLGNKATLIMLLIELKDLFAWSYTDMQGIPTMVVIHNILIQVVLGK